MRCAGSGGEWFLPPVLNMARRRQFFRDRWPSTWSGRRKSATPPLATGKCRNKSDRNATRMVRLLGTAWLLHADAKRQACESDLSIPSRHEAARRSRWRQQRAIRSESVCSSCGGSTVAQSVSANPGRHEQTCVSTRKYRRREGRWTPPPAKINFPSRHVVV